MSNSKISHLVRWATISAEIEILIQSNPTDDRGRERQQLANKVQPHLVGTIY
jgi:hypothetical protein